MPVAEGSGALLAAHGTKASEADAQQRQRGGFGHNSRIVAAEAARLQEHGGIIDGIASIGDRQLM